MFFTWLAAVMLACAFVDQPPPSASPSPDAVVAEAALAKAEYPPRPALASDAEAGSRCRGCVATSASGASPTFVVTAASYEVSAANWLHETAERPIVR